MQPAGRVAGARVDRRRAGDARPWWGAGIVVLTVASTALLPGPSWLPDPVAAFVAVWLALCVQALPFLVLGVLVSGAVVAFLPADALLRVVPPSGPGSVVAAGLTGAVLPGCECASVPIARALMTKGATPAAALTFMLSAPAVNPVVLVSTAVAFPGQPMMVIARFVASLLAAWLVGMCWLRVQRHRTAARSDPDIPPPARPPQPPARPRRSTESGRWQVLAASATHDFLHAGGFLVVGTFVAAAVKVGVPADGLGAVAHRPVLAVLTMALLAVVVCVCSEADAFVASSFTAFSPTAQLVFMTVSPMVDLKLVSMQAGAFGAAFVARFVPLTLAACVVVGSVVGAAAL